MIQAQAGRARSRRRRTGLGRYDASARIAQLNDAVLELEYTLIPHGLHVVGRAPTPTRARRPAAVAGRGVARRAARARGDRGAGGGPTPKRSSQHTATPQTSPLLHELATADALMAEDHEIDGILHALDGRFLRPAPGGDLLRTPAILPTGRNLHGFDPFRIPSAYAVKDGARQAERLLQKHMADGHGFPGVDRARAVGHRQPEERRRPDRPGAVAAGRASRASTATAGWPAPS